MNCSPVDRAMHIHSVGTLSVAPARRKPCKPAKLVQCAGSCYHGPAKYCQPASFTVFASSIRNSSSTAVHGRKSPGARGADTKSESAQMKVFDIHRTRYWSCYPGIPVLWPAASGAQCAVKGRASTRTTTSRTRILPSFS